MNLKLINDNLHTMYADLSKNCKELKDKNLKESIDTLASLLPSNTTPIQLLFIQPTGVLDLEFEPHTLQYNTTFDDKYTTHTQQPDVITTEGYTTLSSTRRGAPPPEVTATVATSRGGSSNYLSLKSKATPGDRGGSVVIGPQVEPAADLREAKGEINREADGRIDLEWKAPCNGKDGPQVEAVCKTKRGGTPSGKDLGWDSEWMTITSNGDGKGDKVHHISNDTPSMGDDDIFDDIINSEVNKDKINLFGMMIY